MDRRDNIPDSDPEFDIWQENLVATVDSSGTGWSIPATAVTALKSKQTVWNAAYAKASILKTRSSADVQDKNDARTDYEKNLRSFISEYLAYNSKITNGDRDRLQIKVHSSQRTPVSVPVTHPVGEINISSNQRHIINYVDSDTNAKGKPAGVHGCEIWKKVGGDTPVDDSEYTYLATVTSSPYIASYGISDISKRVYYRFRWVNTRGETGPWSTPISAIVGG
jgi:hypothetical protein